MLPKDIKPLENPDIWMRPSKKSSARLKRFEKTTGGPLPLSLRAWCEEVGSVSLQGVHALLCRRAGGEPQGRDVPLADPLVIAPFFEEWKELVDEGEDPEELSLAPDLYHKANYSAGEPYGMRVPNPSADGLFTDANQLLFVDYLRLAFRWGGFSGWANYPDRPQVEFELSGGSAAVFYQPPGFTARADFRKAANDSASCSD